VEVGIGGGFGSWSYPDFLDVRAEAGPLDQLVAYDIQPVSLSRGDEGLRVIGRLREGSSVEQAQASVNTVPQRLADEYPDTNEGRRGMVAPLGSVPAEAKGPILAFLGALMGLVIFVLLITCANVAGMFLA
jgi:hypothetical protein